MGIPRSFKYLGNLPDGYEYKILLVDDEVRVIGASIDKPPIGFVIEQDRLIKIDL